VVIHWAMGLDLLSKGQTDNQLRKLTLCKFQGYARWYSIVGFTLNFPCLSNRKSHATRPKNLHLTVMGQQ
jgi:hypothetical protein